MALEEVVAAGCAECVGRKPVVDRASIERKLRQANRSVALRMGRIEWSGRSRPTFDAAPSLAANASKFESPASSRKIVLIPQINDAVSVFPRSNTKYVHWIWPGLGINPVHLTDAFPGPAGTAPVEGEGRRRWRTKALVRAGQPLDTTCAAALLLK